jgi:CRP-like cAMP-binding protein
MRRTSRRPTTPLRDAADVLAAHHPLLVRFPRDELISQTGTYAAGVYLITSGIVREAYCSPGEPSPMVDCGLLGPNELVGWEVLLPQDNELHVTSCRAVSEARLAFLERNAFAAAMRNDESLRCFVLEAFALRRLAALNTLWRRGAESSDRLCSLLLELATKFGSPSEDGQVTLPSEIDRRIIADLIGLSVRQLRKAWSDLPDLDSADDQLLYSPERLNRWWEEKRTKRSLL